MCPASTSTATPSGILKPLVTIACRLEPSGLSDIMRLPLTSRKNRCPEVDFGPCSAIFDLGTVVEDIDFDSFLPEIRIGLSFQTNYTKALKPVIALPTISVFISLVPSYEYNASASAKKRAT